MKKEIRIENWRLAWLENAEVKVKMKFGYCILTKGVL